MFGKYQKSLTLSLVLLLALVIAAALPGGAVAQSGGPRGNLTPVSAEDAAELSGVTYTPRSLAAPQLTEYFVHLADAPLAETWLAAQASGQVMSQATMQSEMNTLKSRQGAVVTQVAALGGQVKATYQKVFNGLAVRISSDKVGELLKIPGVVRISPIPQYTYDLDETVPWIGADVLQDMGYDGTGIRVAVIDSGIDYTHEHLGGSGLQADTDKALAEASQPADPALFPTAKVIGGYDFVGSSWPDTPEMPDPNPMDDEAGNVDGHGTHVASIIGGIETANLGPGVAPGAELYAVKVCSSISTSCSGIALLQAYDWVADPNGDLFFDDRADVVNLSLGSVYGQANSADTMAMEALTNLGSVVVISAGNSGNMPYIAGAPSVARSAISVAQSSVPSAILYRIRRNAPEPVRIMDGVWQPWSLFPTEAITGDVVYGNGDGTNRNGCAAFTADLTGKVALIDRGACNFSLKVLNAEAAGASMAIIAQNAPAAPFEGAWGGEGYPEIPGFMISQADGNALKVAGANVSIDPNDPTITIPLLDVMVGSSSRGPAFDASFLKPNISAPGASVSASSGWQGYAAFGGTSGAAPMVAGAAALVLDAAGGSGSIPPVAVKARLMNNAVTDTWQNFPGGMLNPISRQGAGRVDVEAAVAADTVAWVPADKDVALSFGFRTVFEPYTDSKSVEVINTGDAAKTYTIAVNMRYADDAGVATVTASTDTLTVAAGGNASFDVDLDVADPLALKDWPFTSGGTFANGDLLTAAEVDGFVTLTADDGEVVNVPFHFLPRQAAHVMIEEVGAAEDLDDVPVSLMNESAVPGAVEVYPLFDISPEIALPPMVVDHAPADLEYVGADAVPWDATSNLLLFALSSYNSRSHPINIEYDIYIDIDQDGVDDYVAYNGTVNGVTDPRAVSILVDLAANTATAQFFLDTTLNTTNMVIPVIVPDNDLAFDFQVFTYDAYFTGYLWDWSPADATEGAYHVFDAAKPAFIVDDYAFEVAGDAVNTITPLANQSPSQIGMLYRYLNNPVVHEMEAVVLPTPPLETVTVELPLMADTWVNSGDVLKNNNGFAALIARTTGVDNALLVFDRSALPQGAEIVEASLEVHVAGQSGAFGKQLTALNVEAFNPVVVTYADNLNTYNPSDAVAAPNGAGHVMLDVGFQVMAWDAVGAQSTADLGYLALSVSGPYSGRLIMDSLETLNAKPAKLVVTYQP